MLLRNRAGTSLGELRNASARSFRFPHLRTPTVSYVVDVTHPLALTQADADKVILAVYDDSTGSKVLVMQGPITGVEKTRNAQGGTIAITASGVQWRLDRRLIGKNNTGATFGTSSVSLLDRGEIMGRIIDALNTGEASNIFTDAGDTGIRRGTITASSSTYIKDWRYKPAGQAMSELAGTLDGGEWIIRPTEPTTDATGVQLGALDVAPMIGTVQPNVAFEFGFGHHNVADWKDITDASGLCNTAVSLPSGFPDNATDTVRTWTDATSITDRGLYEDVIAGDVVTQDLRDKLIQNAVRLRKIPRRVISFTPVAEDSSAPIADRRVPRLFADYNVGDTVRFRAVERFPLFDTLGTVLDTVPVQTVDLLMRVFVAQVDLDDNGVASTSLTLVNDGT
jgi:hypothetical protein